MTEMPREESAHLYTSEGGSKRTRTHHNLLLTFLRIFLSLLGLLCPLLVSLSLPFPFIETNSGLTSNWYPLTGWQLLGQAEMGQETWLFTILLLSVLPYLFCLLLLPVKSSQKEALLAAGFRLNGVVNIVGLAVLFSLMFGFSDLYSTYSMDAAYAHALGAFLLSFLCSCILVGLSKHHRRERKENDWLSSVR